MKNENECKGNPITMYNPKFDQKELEELKVTAKNVVYHGIVAVVLLLNLFVVIRGAMLVPFWSFACAASIGLVLGGLFIWSMDGR
jgi:hypothetical protein